MGKGPFRVLVYGYGNPGRQDDGLGPALIGRLEEMRLPGVESDANYQLNIEDAHTISGYRVVIFVDAERDAEGCYSFIKLTPSLGISFTTHAMLPASVLALCQDVYGKLPEAYMLAIPGYEWDFTEGLSEAAKMNLETAFGFIRSLLCLQSFEAIEKASVH
jgi:hydrogenase maturation protease